jgi:leucyl-tRNA synthetase
MFPYPSGVLHIGHARVYTISDVLARAHRLVQHEVIHPMGWDSFGLPAENAAVERGENPRDWTVKNIAQMKSQMLSLGLDFDWEMEVSTCDPSYYKWTQWMFTKLYDAGLAYQKESYVNFDPVDKTVLANEQVDAQGKSWRSGAVVEKKLMKQWYIKITDYADPLLNDLSTLDQWPDRVKKMQTEWIGRNDGASINFALIPFKTLQKQPKKKTSKTIQRTKKKKILLNYQHKNDILTYF